MDNLKEFNKLKKEFNELYDEYIILRDTLNSMAIEDFNRKPKIYFISGHRDITKDEFDRLYKPEIDKVIDTESSFKFVVGDYEGVDIMAQNYLVEKGVGHKTCVYHMFDSPRHFNKEIKHTFGGFTTDIERDSAMTDISDYDIAFVRKGKWNSGTAQNIKRRFQFS